MPERKARFHSCRKPGTVQQKRFPGCLLLIFAVLSAGELLHAEDLGPHDMAGAGCVNCHALTLPTSKTETVTCWGNFDGDPYATRQVEMLESGPELSSQTPSSHSEACLICHDGSMATGMKKGASVGEGHHHPSDIPYPVGQEGYWPGVVTKDGVIFSPTHFDTVYGRMLRFYVSGETAYIECTTCHDPHNHSVAMVIIQGQTMLKPTAHFVRGWYEANSPFSNSSSQFCRSCHYEQSNEAYGIEVATM
jgi:hypothetical protein